MAKTFGANLQKIQVLKKLDHTSFWGQEVFWVRISLIMGHFQVPLVAKLLRLCSLLAFPFLAKIWGSEKNSAVHFLWGRWH